MFVGAIKLVRGQSMAIIVTTAAGIYQGRRGGGSGVNVKHDTNLSVNTPLLVHLLYAFLGPAKLSVACSNFSFIGGESLRTRLCI